MKSPTPDTAQTIQRIRVAMTGLLAVFVLILVASVVFTMTSKEAPVTAIGAAKPDVVANMTDTAADNAADSEPLSELGVLPGAATENSAATPR